MQVAFPEDLYVQSWRGGKEKDGCVHVQRWLSVGKKCYLKHLQSATDMHGIVVHQLHGMKVPCARWHEAQRGF